MRTLRNENLFLLNPFKIVCIEPYWNCWCVLTFAIVHCKCCTAKISSRDLRTLTQLHSDSQCFDRMHHPWVILCSFESCPGSAEIRYLCNKRSHQSHYYLTGWMVISIELNGAFNYYGPWSLHKKTNYFSNVICRINFGTALKSRCDWLQTTDLFDFLFGIVHLKGRRMSQNIWFYSFRIKDTFTSLYHLVLLPKHAFRIQCT